MSISTDACTLMRARVRLAHKMYDAHRVTMNGAYTQESYIIDGVRRERTEYQVTDLYHTLGLVRGQRRGVFR